MSSSSLLVSIAVPECDLLTCRMRICHINGEWGVYKNLLLLDMRIILLVFVLFDILKKATFSAIPRGA